MPRQTFNMRILAPIILILLSSAMSSGTSCCGKKERISTLIETAIDLLSKVKSENISCPEEHGDIVRKPLDCSDLYRLGYNKSGVYTIWPVTKLTSVKRLDVFCDMVNGGWTVIQRRGDFGSANDFFDKDWASYKRGFGSVEKDFWLGNDKIFAITNQKLYSVYFELEDKQRNKAFAVYDTFWIDDEFNKYTLHISGYNGTAGNSMTLHENMKFSTKDQDNDLAADSNCALKYRSGWWFKSCFVNGANLNGMYNENTNGIRWISWKDEYLPRVEIKIRPTVL